MAAKKGLLVAPEFPADSFWSYKYVIRFAGRRAAFPPLGLLTFAALMPDDWEFELIDLNVRRPSAADLRRKIQEADAVFASAMNIQRPSLAALLAGPGKRTDTPWVLGGPMASTYRDTILNPQTPTDHVLHDGLDYLVWGEAAPWIGEIVAALGERPAHSDATPVLFIPDRVRREPEGSRKYLLEKEIFRPIENTPSPRWDLIEVEHYRAMMMQTTAGCRFRCNFCDIVQFNGGFARAKTRADVKRELQAIYDTGFRGSVFTVDDNFVSEPAAMETILEGMIEFQRQYNYPFTFFTQASIDLGKDSLEHLVTLMKQAGFTAVFLGIENPDPDGLKAMNKIQNIKTNPQETVQRLQGHGIEVSAGFIYGCDTDTPQTARSIVDFVQRNGIFSSMTGKLTPMPHTPLYAELREQGRLAKGGDASNNIDESLQYHPIMGFENLQEGFAYILKSLFSRRELYARAQDLLERIDFPIFRGKRVDRHGLAAACHSLARQGLRKHNWAYFGLLKYAFQRDRRHLRAIRSEASELSRFWGGTAASAKDHIPLDAHGAQRFAQFLHYAHEALVRYHPDKGLAEVRDFVHGVRDSIERRAIALQSAHAVYEHAAAYLKGRRQMFRFPGPNLVKAFECAIVGLHYEKVVGNVLAQMGPDVPRIRDESPG
jgi:radical SAM superfamily enzyme YgiQ (UPF0313 family)